jgi:hypothetical protein
MTCPTGYIFQPNNRSCLARTFNSNPLAQNYSGSFPAQITGLDTCPITTPFFNGVSCVGCSNLEFFDFGTMGCLTCQTNTVFDPSTHLCVYKKYNSNVNTNNTNYCCGTLPYDPTA